MEISSHELRDRIVRLQEQRFRRGPPHLLHDGRVGTAPLYGTSGQRRGDHASSHAAYPTGDTHDVDDSQSADTAAALRRELLKLRLRISECGLRRCREAQQEKARQQQRRFLPRFHEDTSVAENNSTLLPSHGPTTSIDAENENPFSSAALSSAFFVSNGTSMVLPPPPLTWPLPPAALRVAERHRRDESRRCRREARQRRERRQAAAHQQQEQQQLCGAGLVSAVAARLLQAATGGATLLESIPPVRAVAPSRAAPPPLPYALSQNPVATAAAAATSAIRDGAGGAEPHSASSSGSGSLRVRRRVSAAAAAAAAAAGNIDGVAFGRGGRSGSLSRRTWRDEAAIPSHSSSPLLPREPSLSVAQMAGSPNASIRRPASEVSSVRSFALPSPGSSGFFGGSLTSTVTFAEEDDKRRLPSDADGTDSIYSSDAGGDFMGRGHASEGSVVQHWAAALGHTAVAVENNSLPAHNVAAAAVTAVVPSAALSASISPTSPSHSVSSIISASASDPAGSDTATHGTAFAELDAIEQGRAEPYQAYLFPQVACVLDLSASSGTHGGTANDVTVGIGSRDSGSVGNDHGRHADAQGITVAPKARPPLQATCVAFSPVGTCYVIGGSQGTLFHVLVPRASEHVTHATYLGGLYRRDGSDGRGVLPSASTRQSMGTLSSTLAPASGAVPVTTVMQPTPLLLGHSAAVTSIVFNDDGSMFASASIDMSVMLWGTANLAKVRRLRMSVPHPSSFSLASPSAATAAANALAFTAPRIVLFTPGNNNYLLVCSRREGVLYNSSTGRPAATNTGSGSGSSGGSSASGRMGINSSGGTRGLNRYSYSNNQPGLTRGGITATRSRAYGARAAFITSACMEPTCAPFFFLGDSQGGVQMCTYRAGELATLPSLRAPSSVQAEGNGSRLMGGGGSNGRGGRHPVDAAVAGGSTAGTQDTRSSEHRNKARAGSEMVESALPAEVDTVRLHSRQLPELRVVATILFHPNGHNSHATGNSNAASSSAPLPIARLEVARVNSAQCLSVLKSQERVVSDRAERVRHGYWPESEPGAASKSGEDGRGKPNVVEHALAEGVNRVAGAFGSLWAAATGVLAGSGSSSSNVNTSSHNRNMSPGSVSSQHSSCTQASGKLPSTATAAATTSKGTASRPIFPRNAALERLCPIILLVSQPFDCVSLSGIVVDFPHATATSSKSTTATAGAAGKNAHRRHERHKSRRDNGHAEASAEVMIRPSGPPRYMLVRLLDIQGMCRLRHVGPGAIPCHDNPRLVAMAIPCEEGFVRVIVSSASTGRVAGGALSVAATLSIPYGGMITDLAWSPDNRFLVAVTREGYLYQWERVYLMGAARNGGGSGDAVAPTAVTTVTNVTRAAISVASEAAAGTIPTTAAGEAATVARVGGAHALTATAASRGASLLLTHRHLGQGHMPLADSAARRVAEEYLEDVHSASQTDDTYPHHHHHSPSHYSNPNDATDGRGRQRPLLPTSSPAAGGVSGHGRTTSMSSNNGAGAVGNSQGAAVIDPVELEEELWRVSLVRERERQTAMRRQRRKNRTSGGSNGTGDSSEESSRYWLGGEDANSGSSLTSRSGYGS